jgi:hypothetical protein
VRTSNLAVMIKSCPVSFPISYHAFRAISLFVMLGYSQEIHDSNPGRGKRFFSPPIE